MTERYKVLGAMITLGEFTVEELAKRTNVKPNTINTVLTRERPRLEEIGYEETGRRGGQPKKYHIRPDQLYALQAELENLYLSLPAPVPPRHQLQAVAEMPLALLTAEDTWLRRYSKADSLEEKQRLFKLASMDYQKGRLASKRILENTTDHSIRQCIESSLRKLDALKGICQADLSVNSLIEEQEKSEGAQSLEVLDRFREVGRQIALAVGNLRFTWDSVTNHPAEEVEGPQTEPSRTESPYYLEAKSLLDRVARENYRNAAERAAYLARAGAALANIRHAPDEEEPSSAADAFVHFEQGRLKYLMRDYDAAQELFEKAEEAFAASEDHAAEVAKIDQHLTRIYAQRLLERQATTTAEMDARAALAALERTKLATSADQPLTLWLKHILSKLLNESSEREKKLKGEISSLRSALAAAESRAISPEPFMQPYMQRSPVSSHTLVAFGISNLEYAGELNAVAVDQVAALGREYCQNPEDLEVKVAIALGSENPLTCSAVDLTEQGYSKRGVASALQVEHYAMKLTI
jgi:tetratricopeptide (TPR) repeat protein